MNYSCKSSEEAGFVIQTKVVEKGKPIKNSSELANTLKNKKKEHAGGTLPFKGS